MTVDQEDRLKRALREALAAIPIEVIQSATLGVYPDVRSEKAPRGRCSCPESEWYRHDSPNDRTPISCLHCGAHWYEQGRRQVDGPPFVPYAEILWAAGLRKPPLDLIARGARDRALALGRVPQYGWWKDPQFNPLMGTDPEEQMLPWITNPAAVRESAERYYCDVFKASLDAGRQESFFDCVRHVPHAFEVPWIAAQITQWRREGTRAAQENLRRAFHEAVDSAKGTRAGAWERIRRDLEVLLFLVEQEATDGEHFKLEGALAVCAARTGLKRSLLIKIWSQYQGYFSPATLSWFPPTHGIPTKVAAVRWLRSVLP